VCVLLPVILCVVVYFVVLAASQECARSLKARASDLACTFILRYPDLSKFIWFACACFGGVIYVAALRSLEIIDASPEWARSLKAHASDLACTFILRYPDLSKFILLVGSYFDRIIDEVTRLSLEIVAAVERRVIPEAERGFWDEVVFFAWYLLCVFFGIWLGEQLLSLLIDTFPALFPRRGS
jgi:hypothetical protein